MKNKEFLMSIIIGAICTVVLSIVMLFINKVCAVLSFALGIALLVVFAVYTKRRYDQLSELNNYLSLVCSGNFLLNISDNSEGELSILQNNLYKVITMLKTSNEAIENDKNYLVDSLADISHQLKTPLTSLMVITDLLKTEEDSENRKKFVCIIENQCEKMKWLIATLLKLSKLDTETVDFIKIQLSISDVLDESLKSFMLTLDLKNIKLETNINDFTFIGDKNWCVEAVQNIIKNCIEHTDENGVLKISTNSTTLYNQLLIEDNGCGIAPEDLPHIFERFYHGKNASSDSVGIGLALSKAILSKHNASVEVNSSQGCGTTFDIRFYKSIV